MWKIFKCWIVWQIIMLIAFGKVMIWLYHKGVFNEIIRRCLY